MANAFQDQRQLGERAQPGQVRPCEHFAKDSGPFAHRRGQILLRRFGEQLPEHGIGKIVGQYMSAQLREIGRVQVTRTPTRDPRVERDDDAFVTCGLGALHETRCQVFVDRRVELEEARRSCQRGRDGLERIVR
jgi:hypothetical protein